MQMSLWETKGKSETKRGGGQLKNAQSNNIEDKAFLLSNYILRQTPALSPTFSWYSSEAVKRSWTLCPLETTSQRESNRSSRGLGEHSYSVPFSQGTWHRGGQYFIWKEDSKTLASLLMVCIEIVVDVILISMFWSIISWLWAWFKFGHVLKTSPKPAHATKDQLKPAAMLQNIPNQHMLFFSTG